MDVAMQNTSTEDLYKCDKFVRQLDGIAKHFAWDIVMSGYSYTANSTSFSECSQTSSALWTNYPDGFLAIREYGDI